MSSNNDKIEKDAETHWEYSKGIIGLSLQGDYNINDNPVMLMDRAIQLMKYFYTQAYIHGYKHGKEEKQK